MKLIVEHRDINEMEILTEEVGESKQKVYKIKGPFLEAVTKNRNGRIYSQELIEREVNRYNQEKIKTKRSIGELDHPPTPTLNLERVSHIIESLEMDGNIGVGSARVLDTPMGKIASSLLSQGIKLGVSTRGVGSLQGSKVNDDYHLICVDLVADPSAPSAFVEGVLENKEYIIDGNMIVETAVIKLEKKLSNGGNKVVYEAMQNFLSDIKNNLREDR
jgi:hypothetical protein